MRGGEGEEGGRRRTSTSWVWGASGALPCGFRRTELTRTRPRPLPFPPLLVSASSICASRPCCKPATVFLLLPVGLMSSLLNSLHPSNRRPWHPSRPHRREDENNRKERK